MWAKPLQMLCTQKDRNPLPRRAKARKILHKGAEVKRGFKRRLTFDSWYREFGVDAEVEGLYIMEL